MRTDKENRMDYDSLLEKYEGLKSQVGSWPELQASVAGAENAELQAARQLVKSLQKEQARLQRLAEHLQQAKHGLQLTVEAFQTLTGMTLTPKAAAGAGGVEARFLADIKDKEGVKALTCELAFGPEELEYKPIHNGLEASLPVFFSEEIVFDHTQGPTFTRELLKASTADGNAGSA